MTDKLKEEYPELKRDLKYYNSMIYNQCREYIKLFLLLEELLVIKDYDIDELLLKGVCDSVLLKMSVLLNELHVSLMKVRTLKSDDDVIVKENGFDRFNYSLDDVNSIFAIVNDSKDSSVSIRVHRDDVDNLDELLNGLYGNYNDVVKANRVLDNNINLFNRLLFRMLDDDGVSDDVKEKLRLLESELI